MMVITLECKGGNSYDIPFRGFVELTITPGEDHSLQMIPCNYRKMKSNYPRL